MPIRGGPIGHQHFCYPLMMVTDELAKHVTEAWGRAGEDWLNRLPAALAGIEERWSVRASGPFDSSYHYVAPAVRADSTEVVLKLGVPSDELRRQVEALRLFRGRGAVRLLKTAPDRGAMMMERLRPGAPLADVPDDQATSIAAGVMKRLWRPAPSDHSFPYVSEYEGGLKWLRGQLGGTSPLPKRLVERAEANLRELLASGNEPVLLHGDLHQWNMLSAGRESWVAIDPKGVVGDAAYELGPFLYNELVTQERPARVLARRLDQFAEELGFERERIVSAAMPRVVLAAWPGGPAEVAWPDGPAEVSDAPLACAELLSEL